MESSPPKNEYRPVGTVHSWRTTALAWHLTHTHAGHRVELLVLSAFC